MTRTTKSRPPVRAQTAQTGTPVEVGAGSGASKLKGKEEVAETETAPALDRIAREPEPDKSLTGEPDARTSGATKVGAELGGATKLPDVVGLRVPDSIVQRPIEPPIRPKPEQEKRYGYKLGPAEPDTFAAEFDKNWGNKDGALGELEAAMHWAALTLNSMFGSHIRFSLDRDTSQKQFDTFGTYINIVEDEFRSGFLDPLEQAGYPVTMEAQMGILLEIATPLHLKKVYGRKPTRRESLDLVAKVMARKHVPITDYLTVITSRGGADAYGDMMSTLNTFMAECERIGWDPP